MSNTCFNPKKVCKEIKIIDGKEILLCPNPHCGDNGYFPVEDGYGGWEQCQCEFCYTVENSLFNYKSKKEIQNG
jgi:hypothetical protein